MMQKALWKLNPFCSPLHNVEVLCVWARMMKGPVKRKISCCTGSFSSFISRKLHTDVSSVSISTSQPLRSYYWVVVSGRYLPLCQIAAHGFSLMIFNIWLPDMMPGWTSVCWLSSQPPGYVLIKQTKSELIATHDFLHKRSSGLKWNVL